jgi:hypothetical protein
MSYANSGKATTAIQEAMAGGVFEGNAHNAWLIFESGKPRNNPLNENQKTRSDFGCSNTLIDFLLARNDPRIDMFANLPNNNTEHVGFPYGMTQAEATPISVDEVSMPSNLIYAPQAPAFFMNYDEVCFILAEAWERGLYSGVGDAQTWYELGIDASMNMWNDILAITPTGWFRIDNNNTNVLPDPITDQQIADYKAESNVAWDAGNALKLIAEQKYIALYPQGLQAWFEWRRTDYPQELIKAYDEVSYSVGSVSGTYIFTPMIEPGNRGIPKRMTYPKDEFTLNQESINNAINAMGPDDFNNSTWWDPN